MANKTLTTLRELTRWYAVGSSTDTSFSDTDTLLSLNSRYQEAFLVATANDGDFEFNGDGSQSISILSGTRSYTLATDLFKVSRVEIKYPSSAETSREAGQINSNQIQGFGKDNYATGRPQFDVFATKIEIFVSAKTSDIEAVSSGITVYYQKTLTELSDGGDTIIFPDVFQRYICIGAAIDYCGINSLNTRLQWLTGEYEKTEAKLTEYVGTRNNAKRNKISFRHEDYGQSSDQEGGRPPRSTIAF